MFKSSKAPALPPTTDFTGSLKETSFYKYGHLRQVGLTGEITAMAVDPLLSLLAVGTSSGVVHVFGAAAFQFTLPVSTTLPGVGRKPDPIKFIVFHPGHHRLVVFDEGNTLHSFALNHITDSGNPNANPPLPTREAFLILHGTVTAVEQPLPSYTHMFFAMKDGVTLAWDLRQRAPSALRIDNLWALHEERLVRSGVPGKQRTIGGPPATCTAINPRDLNILLIGYEGGVVAWDFQAGRAAKIFEMILPPGAPGGGTYSDIVESAAAHGGTQTLWTERTPPVTSITWRPDGLVFAVGHADGCISFWAFEDSDKPIMVRTLTHEDVNVTDAESLMEAGALDDQIRSRKDIEGMPVLPASMANRAPIEKLSWVGFPDQAGIKALMTAQGTEAAGPPLMNATIDYADRGETLLLVLGGQSQGEKPGINIIQFPPYQQPLLQKTGNTISELMSLPERTAYRDSLAPTGSSNYPTKTHPVDFVLLPRSSPYFGMAHDPVAIFITLNPNPKLPETAAPMAKRQFEAFVFPPPRSNIEPPVLGRKTFVTPGDGEKVVAMTPAPVRASSTVAARPASSWRFPWSASPGAQSVSDIPSPTSSSTPRSSFGNPKVRRRFRPPASLWSGGMSPLGCQFMSIPTPTFKRLISYMIETNGNEAVPRVPLRGGMAVPDLQSHGAPDLKLVRMENYRLLCSWHADATVRFWDGSPHILVLPTPLRFENPSPLPHLTINIGEYLRHPSLNHLPLAKLWASDRSRVQIAGVYLARESLECVITFISGEVMVFKFQEADTKKAASLRRSSMDDGDEERDPASPQNDYFPPQPNTQDWVDEVTELSHLAKWKTDGFKPVAVFTVKRGEVTSCAVSDVGFIAVAYASNSLAVLDMRGPDVILREGFNEEGKTMKRRKRKENVQNVGSENSPVSCMKWTISGVGGDASPRPRLVVSYQKGMTKIYGLYNVLGEWMVETKPPTFVNDSLANPLASFILHPESGNELLSSPQALADMMEGHSEEGKYSKEAPPHSLWIAASKKAIRCSVNFNGERVAKVEFDQEELSDVHYITRHGKRVVVALTTTGNAIFYSAPFLEYITRMDLFFGSEPRPIGTLSFDDRSGDFVEYNGPLDIALRTLFHFRKPFPPRIDPCSLKFAMPAQPQPVSASYFSWMWGGAPLTGGGLDALVAGPHRPHPPRAPPAPKRPLIAWGEPPADAKYVPPSTVVPKRTAVSKQRAPTRDARERNDAYQELNDQLNQRTDYLDVLGEQLDSASKTAVNFRNAAFKAAAKNSAGKWF